MSRKLKSRKLKKYGKSKTKKQKMDKRMRLDKRMRMKGGYDDDDYDYGDVISNDTISDDDDNTWQNEEYQQWINRGAKPEEALHVNFLFIDSNKNPKITSIPLLPPNLEQLECEENQLASLPPLPDTLINLNCNNNELESLPPLPNGLEILDCSENQLTLLPTLPPGLDDLLCGNNQLTSLPPLPDTLYHLDCDINDLTSLPPLPDNLTSLTCAHNKLTSLPPLPDSLHELFCQGNPLTSLPYFSKYLLSLSLPQNFFFETLPNNFNDLQEDVHRELREHLRGSRVPIPELLESDITIDTNETAHDVISGDVVIKDYIEENPRHVAIKLGNKVFLADLDAIQRIKEDATRYECYVADTMRPENINRKPEETLFNLKSIGIPAGYGYLMQIEKMLQPQNNSRFYALEKSDKSVASVVSKAILEGTTQYVSASHCQAGQGGDVYNIRIAKGEMVAVGGRKRKTRKRKAGGKRKVGKRKTVKRH